MEVQVLGPLEVSDDGDSVAVGGARIRRLLLSLVLGNGSVVSIDSLIDAVWADGEPPDGARRTVMSYVSRLRGVLGDGVIEQTGAGYRLRKDTVAVDLSDFTNRIERARRLSVAGNAGGAAAQLDGALALWRGGLGQEFAGEHWIEPERVRFEELRLSALEARFEARLALDEHAAVLPDIEQAAAAHPERERLAYLHMLALYRCGRQVEALRQFQTVRFQLADVGVEPSVELRDLERRILDHDVELMASGPEPGTSIRGYQLGEQIGEGSFGTIHRATQPAVGRDVAIKVIRSEFADDSDFIRRFETEAQLVARLEHPHIVPLYDYWREPGGAYLVMRLLRGGNAEEKLVAEGPFALASVVAIVEQVGGALAVAHARGVIHRDVKPANILFDEEGLAYLADFGIAVREERNHSDGELRSAGSPLYASPEQVSGGSVTNRSDIYSLGIATYELLAGRTAFSAESVQALLESKLRASVPSVRAIRPEIPPAIDAVIERATAIDPAHRFEEMGEMILAFRSASALTAQAVMTGDRASPIDVERPRAAASRTLVNIELATVNPYKGLRAFQEADSQDFHGRDELITELVSRVIDQQLVAVVGASGSGKSSVVRAGLLPAITDREWFVVTVVPGSHPLEELEAGLLRVAAQEVPGLLEQLRSDDRGLIRAVRRVLPPDGSELLLVIDQFEEIFTSATTEERNAFLGGLVEAISDERSRIRVVATIRADFYDRPLRHRGFGALLQGATINVLPMSAAELALAIEAPAERLGSRFEPGLVDVIVSDVGENAGMLPLLQYALTELYDRRVSNQMTLAEYRDIGGVTGALARRAEEIYSSLHPADQEAARRLFTRLVTPGEGVEDTRRRALRSELSIVSDDVIEAFGSHRLLSFDRDPSTRMPTVEVAHEALIREWDRLRHWVDDDRMGMRTLRHLTSSSAGWNAADRDPAELYRGARLEAALAWAEGHREDLATVELEFLEASRSLRDRERQEQLERAALREQQNRRLRRSLVGVGILAVMALLASGFAFQQWGNAGSRAEEAADARASAETRRLISDAGQLAATNRRVALLLAAEGYRRAPDAAALGGLQSVLTESRSLLGYVAADLSFTDIEWTTDGRLVGSHSAGVTVFDSNGDRLLEIPMAGARLIAVRADDAVVAVAGSDSSVRVFDLGTGSEIASPIAFDSTVVGIAFSSDGRRFATGERAGIVRVFDQQFGLLATIDAHTDATAMPDPDDLPEGIDPPLLHDPVSFRLGVIGVALSADGRTVASVGGANLRAWDIDSLTAMLDQPVTRSGTDGGSVLVAPTGVGFVEQGGREYIAASSLFDVELWSAEDDERVDRWEFAGGAGATPRTVTATSVTFDRAVVATISGDGRVRTAAQAGTDPVLLDTQLGGDLHLAIDEPNGRLVVAGAEGAVVVSLVGVGLISRSVPTATQAEFFVSDDGTMVLGSAADARPSTMWKRVGSEYEVVPIPGEPVQYGFTGLPGALAFNVETGVSQERDPVTFEPFGPTYGPHSAFQGATSPDGRWIVFGLGAPLDAPGAVVYERSSGRQMAVLDDMVTDQTNSVRSLGFNSDSSRLVISTDDGASRVYETATWGAIEPVLSAGGGAVVQAKFTPNGRHLVTASIDGAITVRDAETLQPDGQPLLGNTEAVEGFSLGPMFSPDGRWMVTTMDGETRLWDFEERVLIGKPFPQNGEATVFASSNARFAITFLDGRAVIWDVDPARWPEVACQAAGRNLTLAEWEQFGPAGEPYVATCPQWPSLGDLDDNGGG